jgi:Ca2+-transporting ATPase
MSSASSRASCGYTSGGSSLVSFSQGHSHKLFFESESIHLEALRPDPGYEEDFEVENNPFAFSPGQLNKLMNPKSLAALKALGGLKGLEKGLRTNRKLGLSIGETILSGCVSFEQAVGETLPFETQKCDDNHIGESLSNEAHSELFRDRKRVFKDNRLPRRPLKSFERCIWKNIIDPLYVLLLVPAVVCFALGMSRREQTYRMGEDLNDGTWQQALTVVAFIVAVVFAESGLGWVTERRRLKSQPLVG